MMIFTIAMNHFKAGTVEDNENGVKAARASGAHVLVVSDPSEVNIQNIRQAISRAEGQNA